MNTETREHALPCKPEMVRAIFEDRKTQTRRLITPQNSYLDGGSVFLRRWRLLDFSRAYPDDGPSPAGNPGPYLHVPMLPVEQWSVEDREFFREPTTHRVYPRVQPGDVLWVREQWVKGRDFADTPIMAVYIDDPERPISGEEYTMHPDAPAGSDKWALIWSKHPSIHMPRWACRYLLDVSEVRAERVQDISEEDARAEGAELGYPGSALFDRRAPVSQDDYGTHRGGFYLLWDSINGHRHGCSWADNPWTWVYTFRRQA